MNETTIVKPGQIIAVIVPDGNVTAWTDKTCGPIALVNKQRNKDVAGNSVNVTFFFQVSDDAKNANLSIGFKFSEPQLDSQEPLLTSNELFFVVTENDDQSLTH